MDRNAHARDALLIAPTPRSSADPWTRDFIGRWGRSESSIVEVQGVWESGRPGTRPLHIRGKRARPLNRCLARGSKWSVRRTLLAFYY